MHAPEDRQIIRLPNLLGSQAGEGMSEQLLKSAEAAVQALAADYLDWLGSDLTTLERLVDDLAPPSPRDAEIRARVRDILHNMKGNGSTFGFDLVTEIAKSGGSILSEYQVVNDQRCDALRHHIAALRVVVDRKITGSGGEPGKRLLKRLQDIAASLG